MKAQTVENPKNHKKCILVSFGYVTTIKRSFSINFILLPSWG